MELKVWCDGIQRIVCGATATTTCQDVVFALAHATGQTGRFILIEKWKHNERVLSPSDQPIISLSKWGEYANDVTFIMKKSGDVVSSKQNKVQTPKLGKKSDSDLMQKRKKANQENNFSQTVNQSMGMIQSQSSPMLSSIRGQQRFMAQNNFPISQRILLKSSSQSQSVEERDFLSLRNHNKNDLHPAAGNNMFAEPLYGSLNKNRPRQPPPYKEAIAKSTLVNIMHNSNNFDHNYTVTGNIGSSQITESPNDNLNNQQQVTMFHRNSLPQHQQPPSISSTLTNSDSLQQKTISLISIQQKTLKKQGKNMAELENEIDLVQRKLSENELIVNQYRDDMEFLKQKWIEQEMHIEKLESDNLEKELEKLINDGRHYETEMKEIRFKLSNCENEIIKRREEIGILMNQIEDYLQLNPEEFDNMNHTTLIDRLKVSIQDKNNKIQTQKMDLDVLNDSIEHFDQTIQIKNSIVDKLIYQIKEANVEGLTLQSGANTPSEEKNFPTIDPSSLKSGTNRKIPVSLHELGNTVPTKKNPDGIWV